MKPFDFLVIGGGSAGFNAARVAAGLGQRVAIVDGARELGGLCILRGCMPSKTLIHMAEVLHLAQKAKTFGLKIPRAAADMRAMHARKKKIIAEFADHRAKALASGGYKLFRSHARFADPHTVELDDGKKLTAQKILVATGSRVSVPPIPGLAGTPAWTSDDVLDLDFIPESVLVLGGGIVACELSQFLRRIGSRVVQVQRSAHILSDHSPEASGVVAQSLRDDGIELFAGTKILRVAAVGGGNNDGSADIPVRDARGIAGRNARAPLIKAAAGARGVAATFEHGGKTITRRARHLFNALGREPLTDGLNLAAAGVKLRAGGRIAVNRFQQTSAPHIYAGGDVCGPHDIVHLAVAQGELAARHASGVPNLKPIDNALLLNVVFTSPALATIGVLEGELREKGVPFLSAGYPFNDHGKSILMDENYGFVKVIAEPKRGRLLGAEIVGPQAGELIHCFNTPLAMRATVFDMLRAPWYHPTLAEIITYPLEEIADRIGAGARDRT
ncbi:NAD(P)/FAD-dependent oxidoreductase [Termitidicoccus mucosus]|uniref:Pyridine nucleotide-disulfide oxidoreductase n=1 Tax=Termitidicoccus mucosus TaxID=1184151 RepID=A0A178IMN9_9BACT|nr:pyridine nucleotide-disulfide oxidoreductase [Opitutaceae bacterium TSB47]